LPCTLLINLQTLDLFLTKREKQFTTGESNVFLLSRKKDNGFIFIMMIPAPQGSEKHLCAAVNSFFASFCSSRMKNSFQTEYPIKDWHFIDNR
jgi:hypothetical protein